MKIPQMFGSIEEFTGIADGVQGASKKAADLVDYLRVDGVEVVVFKATSVTRNKTSASFTKSIRKTRKSGTPNGGVVTGNMSKGGSDSVTYGGGVAVAGATGRCALGQ